VQKVFILKYADPSKVASLLSVFTGQAVPSGELHALSVTCSPDIMPGVEQAIKQLDVPAAAPPNIELTAYYLIGGETESPAGSPVPKELDSVVTQLKNSFAFKAYRLLDELTLRTRAGFRADTSGAPGPIGPGSPSITTQFRIQSAALSADGSTVRIDRMQAGVHLPVPVGTFQPGAAGAAAINTQYSFQDLGVNADIDIKEGQKVVVGRLSVNKDQALFLVLTARVVN
jgi:hypothetical protein